MSGSYYNECDEEKAAWLREVIKAGIVAPGDVDERSITDVSADDLRGYTQCHFFAGIGVWSYALRLAKWPDDRPVWTGSCPCPSFSAAGKGLGFADPRHLWPEWYRLIRVGRPGTVFGEQVAAAIGHGWLDLVCGDMEAEGYAIAPAVLGAHSAGAPHIRQRLYFCAHDNSQRCAERTQHDSRTLESELATSRRSDALRCGEPLERAHNSVARLEIGTGETSARHNAQQRPERLCDAGECSDTEHDGHDSMHRTETITHSDQPRVGLFDGDGEPGIGGNSNFTGSARHGEHSWSRQTQEGLRPRLSNPSCTLRGSDTMRERLSERECDGRIQRGQVESQARETTERTGDTLREWRGPGWLDPLQARSASEAGATRGFWADCDWWYGRDGKYRPIGPGLFPLAHGAAARVLRLRGYGDAINPWVAKEFIEAFKETQQGE